jgi:hypothetical protein
MSDTNVCLGSRFVVVEAELKNVSGKKVAVAPEQLFYAYSFLGIPKDYNLHVKDRDSINDSVSIDWPKHNQHSPKCACVVLHPGESVKKSIKLDLGEPAFFDEVGNYRVQIRYGLFDGGTFKGASLSTGVVPSNEFQFVVEECKH